jgi:putative peptidoglycan lipid II flippase
MAMILGALAVAILFRAIYHITVRAFYAQQNTKTPLYVSLFSISLNIVLAIGLSMYLDMGAYGLAWAQSIVAVVEVVILFAILKKQKPGLFDHIFINAVTRMVISAVVMAVVCYLSVKLIPFSDSDNSFFSAFPKFTVIVAVSFFTYGLMSKILKLKEIDPILEKISRVMFARIESK